MITRLSKTSPTQQTRLKKKVNSTINEIFNILRIVIDTNDENKQAATINARSLKESENKQLFKLLNSLNNDTTKALSTINNSVSALKRTQKAVATDLANTVLKEIKNLSEKAPTPSQTYATAVKEPARQERKLIPDEVIIIKCENDADEAINEIKARIKPSGIGVAVTSLYKSKADSKIGVLKVKNKSQAKIMIEEIKKLQLSATPTLAKKLQPAIIIFGIEGITEEDIKLAVLNVIGKEPTFVSLNLNSKTAVVRFEKHDYYNFISASPNRLLCEYSSFRYQKHMAVRVCKKCRMYGHSKDRCKAAEHILQIKNSASGKKRCLTCCVKNYDDIVRLHPDIENPITAAIRRTDHGMYDQSCPVYSRLMKSMEKRYDL